MAAEDGSDRTRLLSRTITTRERKALVFGAAVVGVLSGTAQFLTADFWHDLQQVALSAAIVLGGVVCTLVAIRVWQSRHKPVTIRLNVLVVALALFTALAAAGGLAGHALGLPRNTPPASMPAAASAPPSEHVTGSTPPSENTTATASAPPSENAIAAASPPAPDSAPPVVSNADPSPPNEATKCATDLNFDDVAQKAKTIPVGLHTTASGTDFWSAGDHLWIMVAAGGKYFPTEGPPQRKDGRWRSEYLQFGQNGSGPDRLHRQVVLIIANDTADRALHNQLATSPDQSLTTLPTGAAAKETVDTIRSC